jgi:hypothetical protein
MSDSSSAPYVRIEDKQAEPARRRQQQRRHGHGEDDAIAIQIGCCGCQGSGTQLFGSIAFTSFILLVLFAVVLSSAFYLGSLQTITQGSATAGTKFFLYVDQVEIVTASSDIYKSLDQLAAADTQAILTAEHVIVGISLFCVVSIFAVSLLYSFDGVRTFAADWSLFRAWGASLPYAFSVITVVFTLASVLIILAIPHAAERDDFIAQVTAGAVTCSTGVYDCGAFWVDHLSNQSDTTKIRDLHRPSTSWFIQIVAFFISIYLSVILGRTKSQFGLEAEFAENEQRREDEARAREEEAAAQEQEAQE